MMHSDTYYFDIIRYNIKKHREAAGLTQQQLADKAGITMNYVAKIESKKIRELKEEGHIYKRVNKECKEFRDIFWKNRNFARIEEATEHLSNNPYVKIFRAGYRELTQIKDKDSASNGYYLDILRRILERSAISELRKLEFGNTFLATVATAAPFVGLFGTVWGIMVAFQGLSAVKTTTLQAVAPGISEALIATAVGLAAAIPASVAYNFFAVKVKNYKEETSGFISEFLSISAKYLVQ